jgi:outer membrane biosynthesis protein TonB
MNIGRQFVWIFLALVLLAETGCQKKQPQIPSQAQAPAEPIYTPLPPEIAQETPPEPEPEPEPEPAKVAEPKPQPAKHHKKKPSQSQTATAQSSEATAAPSPAPANSTVASARPPANPANEAPPDTAIAADVSSAQLTQQKQTTAQLLESTEKTLNGLPRNLSHDDEQMVAQIRSYLTQSRKATTDGDFERAYNLATKAHLLSDALVKK